MAAEPLLSIVATSRNDNHGENLLHRMQHFVDALDHQSPVHDLAVELVLVEWNSPPERPGLLECLKWPHASSPLTVRVIRVPNAIHRRIRFADRLPIF